MEIKCMKLVYGKYYKKDNAVREHLITTKKVTPSFAEQYINKHNNKPVMCYCPGLVDTDFCFSMWVETDAFKREHKKVVD